MPMDEIARAVGAYRACIDLPDDVTDDELRQEAGAMLGHAMRKSSSIGSGSDRSSPSSLRFASRAVSSATRHLASSALRLKPPLLGSTSRSPVDRLGLDARRQRRPTQGGAAVIRIAITIATFEAIAATLPLIRFGGLRGRGHLLLRS